MPNLRNQEKMETYDWAWVERQVAQTEAVWRRSSGRPATEARSYSADDQQRNEKAYDEALLSVEEALRSASVRKEERACVEERIIASFAQFSARALDLDEDSIDLLTRKFVPAGTALARWAREFDPDLSMSAIVQAARNAWTACGLQPLLGAPLALTPSILGYSLMYPYSDNFLDDEEISAEAKLRFSRRFRRKLLGERLPPEDDRERNVWTLIGLVETQYPRDLYPNVFECLLAIHRAQEQSVGQVREPRSFADAECLRVSCGKGGSSVLADACLVRGSLTAQESQFGFEWGVLLQLGDDLQDVGEDMERGSMTLFSRAAADGRLLDGLTIQLSNFSEHVGRLMDELPQGEAAFKGLLKMSWRSLIVAAVADSHKFFSAAFLREAERFSPFRFEFLRARKARLSSRQGVYTRLFGTLLDSSRVSIDGLPSPHQPADWAAEPDFEAAFNVES
ncbi:MAG TPA: hypothetical protein VHZ07_16665 [Bryobacteraceae bacterium]|jgi:hypothetical protein|nr:hypothetical protein [Bryobacteraceae bacterium]